MLKITMQYKNQAKNSKMKLIHAKIPWNLAEFPLFDAKEFRI